MRGLRALAFSSFDLCAVVRDGRVVSYIATDRRLSAAIHAAQITFPTDH
jgi:hypothetical protein